MQVLIYPNLCFLTECPHDVALDLKRVLSWSYYEYAGRRAASPFIRRTDSLFNMDRFSFPRGVLNRVLRSLGRLGVDYTPVRCYDEKYSIPPTVTELDGPDPVSLRDYQVECMECLLRKPGGVYSLPPGTGKTEVAIGLVKALDRYPVAWFTDSCDLLHQTRERFEKRLGGEIGIVGDQEMDLQPITVFLVQSLLQEDPRAVDQFVNSKVLFIDECVPASTEIAVSREKVASIEEVFRNPEIETVLSYDLERGCFVEKRILKKIKRPAPGFKMIRVEAGDYSIVCTPSHKIWTTEGFIRADQLGVGNVVRLQLFDQERLASDVTEDIREQVETFVNNHLVEVTRVVAFGCAKEGSEPIDVYDLKVEDTHCYFANRILISNSHHLPADTWFGWALRCQAFYRYGCTATLPEEEDGLMKMIGVCGDVSYVLQPMDAVEMGVLVPPRVVFVTYNGEQVKGNYQERYKGLIVGSETPSRNEAVVSACEECIKLQRRTLVLVIQHEHARRLDELLQERFQCCLWEIVTGRSSTQRRDDVMQQLLSGKLPLVIATPIFDEGVDMPEVDAMIIAGANKKDRKNQQRGGRGMRPGKSDLLLIDFWDASDNTFLNHSRWRKRSYEKLTPCGVESVPVGRLGQVLPKLVERG